MIAVISLLVSLNPILLSLIHSLGFKLQVGSDIHYLSLIIFGLAATWGLTIVPYVSFGTQTKKVMATHEPIVAREIILKFSSLSSSPLIKILQYLPNLLEDIPNLSWCISQLLQQCYVTNNPQIRGSQ